MPVTRRSLIKVAAAAPFLAAMPALADGPAPGDNTAPGDETAPGDGPARDDSLRADIRRSARFLGLPGFVAGVVRDGKLSLVQAEGFADLEGRTPLRRDHLFYLASVTKTFTAVMMMQYVQEKRFPWTTTCSTTRFSP
jgi:CubicO group peptidase (beta-lactamase class C family)